MESFGIAIHGGTGTIEKDKLTTENEIMYRDSLKKSLEAGYEILNNGGTALNAIQASIVELENCPLFNAGKGAVFNAEGRNELDAAIMDGKFERAGAVACVTMIKNPIIAARAVMEKSEHILLSGEGAEKFAEKAGVEKVDPSYFFTEEKYKSYLEADEKHKKSLLGTVGAVALDKSGNIAAGTSTGGMTYKKYGRVGGVPLIGAGTYANSLCGISGTGHGEYFIRTVLAHDIAARMEYKNISLEEASKEVILSKVKEMGGEAGIIGIDKYGNITLLYNTEGMYRGYVKSDGKIKVAILKEYISNT